MDNKTTHQGNLSKITVAILILVILLGTGVFIWWSYQPTPTDNKLGNEPTDTSSLTQENNGASTNSNNEFDVEINQLDESMNSLDDEALSDSSLDNSKLGI